MLAMRRRVRDHGAAALQQFGEDFLPLILLFAVSVTGLMLTASYTWMKGYGYEFLAILHAVTVIFTLLWLPFGKFFHIFQRPAQLGVGFYKDVGRAGGAGPLPPLRPGVRLADARRGPDRRRAAARLSTTSMDGPAGHYQWICPRCRRVLLALAQATAVDRASSDGGTQPLSSQPLAATTETNG